MSRTPLPDDLNQLAVAWAVSAQPVDYLAAVAAMERRADAIAAGNAPELIWLLEHPPLYTAGTSARLEDLIEPARFPVHWTGRGGQFTYHGPGQRVVYVMLDLKRRGGDVRAFVQSLERWVIATLSAIGVEGAVRADRIGVWVPRPARSETAGSAAQRPATAPATTAQEAAASNTIHSAHSTEIPEDKIAAIGIRVRRWVSFHGLAINVTPTLAHFDGIVPCGITGYGVTSLADLGNPSDMAALDDALRRTFPEQIGGRLELTAPPL